MNTHPQHGSIFFYILLAIALIAALTYFVSSGSRTSTGMLSEEQARIVANEVVEYGNTIAAAVQKLRLRGCSNEEISAQRDWDNSGAIQDIAADGYIAASPTDKSCHLFDIAGGGLNYKYITGETAGNIISSQHRIEGLGCNTASIDCTELLYAIKDISDTVCSQINTILNTNLVSIPLDSNGTSEFSLHDGFTYAGGTVIGDEDTDLEKKQSACYQDSDDTDYHFYQVLLER